MKPLVVYFSHSGNTKKIAELIADRLSSDIEVITLLKERKGFPLYFLGGFKSSTGLKEKISAAEKNPSEYDLVILCTPVWAWGVSSPVQTYWKKLSDKPGRTAHVMCAGGDVSEKTFTRFVSLTGEPAARLGLSMEDISTEAYREKLSVFFNQIESLQEI